MGRRSRGSALVEFTFLAPILMLFFLGLVGLGVEVWAQLGLVAVAEEAAHAAAVAPDQIAAVEQGSTRGYQVGTGYRLGNGSLRVTVDASQFGPGGRVSAAATYHLGRTEIPLLSGFDLALEQEHVELVSQFRSFPQGQPAP
jgi:Flp pilus assembly protein TadG